MVSDQSPKPKRTVMQATVMVLGLLGGLLYLDSTPALAVTCDGTVVHTAVGGNEDATSSIRYGNRADVFVNNPGPNQYKSWRAVAIVNNPANFVEAGWERSGVLFSDQKAHPYKTTFNLGVPDTDHFSGLDFNAGSTHEFKVHDQNGDQNWSFAYDGNSLGNESMSMVYGFPLTESERMCSEDSLVADFTHLNRIAGVGGAWADYTDVERYINSTSNWNYCGRTTTRYEVLKDC